MRVTVLTIDQVAELMAWHTACNAYCRGEEHADVVWLATDSAEGITEAERESSLRACCISEFGVEYVGHAPAPEAAKTGEMCTAHVQMEDDRPVGISSHDGDIAAHLGQTPYLVRFRTPWPIEDLRALVQGEGGTATDG